MPAARAASSEARSAPVLLPAMRTREADAAARGAAAAAAGAGAAAGGAAAAAFNLLTRFSLAVTFAAESAARVQSQQEALEDDAALASELADDEPTTPGGPLDALADAELDLEFERLVHSASKW